LISAEHMRIDPAYRARLQACGLDTVTQVLTRVDGRVAAWSRTTDTLHVPGPGDEPGFYVKRYFFPNWVKRLRGALRGTFFGMHRGQAEYRALQTLRRLGIPAVRPVAYGGGRIAHFLAACFLITEEVPDAVNLTTFALDVACGRRMLSLPQRRALVRTLAEQLAALRAAGCSHGNLLWRNVLVRYGPGGCPEFFFLDPQPPHSWQRATRGWSFAVPPGGDWWLHELAQVAVSAMPFTTRTERLRFMRHYLSATRLTPEIKLHLAHIQQLAETRRQHEDRRIRMNRLFEEWNRQLAEELRRTAPDEDLVQPEPGS
jgi:hypothetical protein